MTLFSECEEELENLKIFAATFFFSVSLDQQKWFLKHTHMKMRVKMEHNAFLTTVDLHKIKTTEKRTVQILRDEADGISSSSSSSDSEFE